MEKEIKLEAKIPKEPMILSSKKKWFWVGIVIGTISVLAGIIYGVALVKEKNYRKEGWKIVIWSILWMILLLMFVPMFVKNGYLPQTQRYLPQAPLLPIAK